jgi:hypothetical protein
MGSSRPGSPPYVATKLLILLMFLSLGVGRSARVATNGATNTPYLKVAANSSLMLLPNKMVKQRQLDPAIEALAQ